MSSCRGRSPAGPPDRLGDGSVAQGHHAKQGGQRDTLRAFGGEHHRSIIGVPSWEQLLRRQGSIQPGRQEMNPLIGRRLGPPKELPWYFLNGMLLPRRQHEEPFVGYGG